jgi:acetyltransferase-like isoleucine patch superfamily enzyme
VSGRPIAKLKRAPRYVVRRALRLPPLLAATFAPRELTRRAWMAYLRRRFGSIGRGTEIEWPIDVITEPQCIFIGEYVRIRKHARLEAIRATPDADPGRVVIGDRTSMEGYCSIAAAVSVEIGPDVLFGANVAIRDNEHGYRDLAIHRAAQPLSIAGVRIGGFAWLGQNVVVTKGTTIGHGAVVGANAVVTTDVPEGAVVGGVPARQIGWADGRPFSRVDKK